MKKLLNCLLLLSVTALLPAEEFITVYKDGRDFFVRSRFSETEDLIIHTFRYANEKSYLVKRGTPIQEYAKGKTLHSAGDEYPATISLGDYGTLSGNHGSFFTRLVTVPGHKLTTEDEGNMITDNAQKKFVILKIVDKNNILIHPEGVPDTFNPRFTRHQKQPLFYKGKRLAFTSSVLRQLYPQNRITEWKLLADGTTPVPEKKEIKCRFVDFIFVHDVLDTYHIIQTFKKGAPGGSYPQWDTRHSMQFADTPALRKQYADYMKLPALVTYSNKFRFQPRGACVNYREALYHTKLSQALNLDVMFVWSGAIAQQKKQLFYVPKMKILTVKQRNTKQELKIDLTGGYLLPRKLNISHYISNKEALDPNDLPDRFIRVSGPDAYHYGIALGYSLFMGVTKKGSAPENRQKIYHLYRSHKMYPYSSTLKNITPGQRTLSVVYRQYFNPRLEPDATSFYCHYQGNSLIVYLDFHKVLKNKTIKLPTAAAGKKITVLEKTKDLTLHTQTVVPGSGIQISNNAKHGFLVLKLD